MTICNIGGCVGSVVARGWCRRHYSLWWYNGDPNKHMRATGNVEARLRWHGWDETPRGCWEFRGPKHRQGYGRIKINNTAELVHRLAYEAWVGPIPEGLIVRHKCDNPPCINPEHLETGTHKDNSDDKIERGRQAARSGEDHYGAKLTWREVREMRTTYKANGVSERDLARRYGVGRTTVSKILKYKTWRESDDQP